MHLSGVSTPPGTPFTPETDGGGGTSWPGVMKRSNNKEMHRCGLRWGVRFRENHC